MGDAYLPYMLSRPGVYDGARSSLRRGRRVPEKGAVATNAAGAGKRSSGSIMAHHLQLTHKSASSLSALLLASTFWMELHVPFAEQQVPLQFLVPAVPPWCSEWGLRSSSGGACFPAPKPAHLGEPVLRTPNTGI